MLTVELTDGSRSHQVNIYSFSIKKKKKKIGIVSLADSGGGGRSIPACVKEALRSKNNTLAMKVGAWLHVWV